MEKSICFTQIFVDKQNVRSFGTIFKLCLLKEEQFSRFLQNIFIDDVTLVSHLKPEIIQNLQVLQTNLQILCKDDFKSYFPQGEITKLTPTNKLDVFNYSWNCLRDIIPKSFIANRHNKDLLKRIVHSIIWGMKRQHIQVDKVLRKWNFLIPPWTSVSAGMLHMIVVWILQNILCPAICLNYFVTTSKLDADENKLCYFWKNHWHSFYDRTIHKMIKKGIIKKVDFYSLGKKMRRNYDIDTIIKLKNVRKDTPKLHLLLKVNDGFRPIIRYKNDTLTIREKYKIKNRLNFLKLLAGNSHRKIETLYYSVYLKWLKHNKPQLYFVKTDLSNAFGCVNKLKLVTILKERFLMYQKSEKVPAALEKNTYLFNEIITELKKPILIRAGSTIYVWRKGLVQGYKYSPALSELYYKHLDEIYFSDHITTYNDRIKLFIRVVDDYLYITDSYDDAKDFLKALSNYDNVNHEKTVVNFNHPGIKYNNEITFLGYSYNTLEMQVSRAQNVFAGQMCYKITFNNAIDNLNRFIETRIGQSSVKINSHMFNFHYNTECLIWEHIFTTFCLTANKFCTILALLSDANEMATYIVMYKKKVTVKLSNNMLEVLLKNKPNDFLFLYCINHLRYLSWLALVLCAKKTPKCCKIVPNINDELLKNNCIFGKWREHASRIDTNGQILQKARRDICKRPDLKLIMKKFQSLPECFQCYNHKFLYK